MSSSLSPSSWFSGVVSSDSSSKLVVSLLMSLDEGFVFPVADSDGSASLFVKLGLGGEAMGDFGDTSDDVTQFFGVFADKD